MLESQAYQTYYAFASKEKNPKPKYVRKKADFDTSPKKKSVQATKVTRIKNKAKLATKRSNKDFHISHESGSGDGVDTQSKVHDEQQQNTSGTDEGTGTIPGVVDVPIYTFKTDEESWGDSDEEDDDENNFQEETNINDDDSKDIDEKKEEYDDEFNIDDQETMYNDEDDEVTKELYEDVNVNLRNKDADITNADQGGADQQNASKQSRFEQEEEDAYVMLTLVLEIQKTGGPTQSSSVSSDFTSKLLNLDNPSPNDTMIGSLMDTTVQHEITSATTVPPPPLFFNLLQQEATPTHTPKTSEATTSFTSLLDFMFVFKFNERVTNLEKDLSEIKQVDQYAQAPSFILAIVKPYMDNKLREEINKAIQAHNLTVEKKLKLRKRNVATPIIKRNVTKSLEVVVLTRYSSQPQSSYEAAATLSEFELTKILIDKIEKNKSFDVADYKRELYDALIKSYNTDKDIFKSYGEVFSLKRSQDERDKDRDSSTGSNRGSKRRKSKEPSHTIKDSCKQQDQEFVTRDNDAEPADKEVTKVDWFKKPKRPPTPDPYWSKRQQIDFRPPQIWISEVAHAKEPLTSFDELNDTLFDFSASVINRLNITNLTQEILVGPVFNLIKGTCKSITKLEFHIKECSKATTKRLDWHNPENIPYPFDLRNPLLLIQDHRGRQIIPKDYFINKDLEYLKGRDLSRIYSTSVTKTKAATYELK
uniref:Uncharacterized protein n=1 Tax=Tanacetum cinerariifolium TaxID=118510 RepID=A0A6L2KZ74_TANCI|nr:hypothetical protein [Tanacetum cinerariifolium]